MSQLSCDDSGSGSHVIQLGKKKDHALPMLSFSCIVASTNNFSPANKLGEGGYGPVYKVFVTLYCILISSFCCFFCLDQLFYIVSRIMLAT